jgi:hypothetical protein
MRNHTLADLKLLEFVVVLEQVHLSRLCDLWLCRLSHWDSQQDPRRSEPWGTGTMVSVVVKSKGWWPIE